MKAIILLTGEYVVINKESWINKIHIPGVQTCCVLILETDKKVGITHIDSPYGIENHVQDIIEKLRGKDTNTAITATIIGGDYGIPYISSHSNTIFKPIYNILKAEDIPIQHDYYSYAISPIIPSTYLLLRLLGFVGPSSYMGSTLCFFGCVLIEKGLERILEYAQYSNNNYNVTFNIPSGKIEITTSSFDKSIEIIKQATPQQLQFWSKRCSTSPRDPKNRDQLPMRKLDLKTC